MELLNTLAVTFTATEYAFTQGNKNVFYKYRCPLAILSVLNLLVTSIDHRLLTYVHDAATAPWVLLSLMNSSFLFAGLATCFIGALLLRMDLSQVSFVFLLFGLFGVSYGISHWVLVLDSYPGSANVLAKIAITMVAYSTALLFDIKRYSPTTDARSLAHLLAQSLFFSLPLLPLCAIVISTAFLLIATLVQSLVGRQPDFLDVPIYYGTIYGPFVIIYVNAKKSALANASSYLPS